MAHKKILDEACNQYHDNFRDEILYANWADRERVLEAYCHFTSTENVFELVDKKGAKKLFWASRLGHQS